MTTIKTIRRDPGRNLLAAACAVALFAVFAVTMSCSGEGLTAVAEIESQHALLGEPLSFRISVTGGDSPVPDLTGVADFSVRDMGVSQSSRSSFTIVMNGRQIKKESGAEIVFSYELVPKKTGLLTVPSIAVVAQGTTVRTEPIQVKVDTPAETSDFKLRLSLSKTRCYAGEPVILRVVWYIGARVGNYQMSLPVLESDAFTFADPHDGQFTMVQITGGTLAAVQGRTELDGRQYDAVEFSKILIPKRAGTFEISPATIACAALTGRGTGYRKVVVPSGGASLEVLAVPLEGRPAGFAGHVGDYKISASATPVEVNVGDPITLTIVLSGPEYMENIELPSLGGQPALARDFKIPSEIAAGKTAGGAKVFTQSIRAQREDVQCIPPIELAYFDTKSGKYGVARSAVLPLKVKPTRVITPGMVEGGQVVVAGSALEAWGKGISHNYEGSQLLSDQRAGPAVWIKSPRWICALSLPPFTYFMVLAITAAIRRRNADPLTQKARKAFGRFDRACSTAGKLQGRASPVLLEAMREYLGSKLRIPSAAMSFNDVQSLLAVRDVDQDIMTELRLFFEQCEADSYAGGSGGSGEGSALAGKALGIVRKIERELR